MTRRARRNHSSTFKAKVAVNAIRGERRRAELAKLRDVRANQVVDWKNQLLTRRWDFWGRYGRCSGGGLRGFARQDRQAVTAG